MNEELRIQVAKCLGWTEIHTLDNGEPYGWHPKHYPKQRYRYETPLPHFDSDLNACHEFELALFARKNKRNGQVWRYLRNGQVWRYLYESALSEITGGEPISATAEQRCRALLKIKGEEK